MDSSFWFDTVNLGWSIVHIYGCMVILFKSILYSLSEDLFHLHSGSVVECLTPDQRVAGSKLTGVTALCP